MGLDIFINTDNDDALRTPEYFGNEDHFRNSHRVSRSFCDLMCRQNVISGEPELDQVGRIAGVDIEPLYEMERYISQDDAELMIEFSGQTVGEVSRNEMTNISKVITTVSTLTGTHGGISQNYGITCHYRTIAPITPGEHCPTAAKQDNKINNVNTIFFMLNVLPVDDVRL